MKKPAITPRANQAEAALGNIRAKIDQIDQDILHLLNERARYASETTQHKKSSTPFDPGREIAKFKTIKSAQAKTGGPLRQDHVAIIFKEIISACRDLQAPVKVSFLGPLGSFSHEASLSIFGHFQETFAMPTFLESVHAAAAGTVDFAVIPVENTTEGVVAASLDALMSTPQVKIYGEFHLPVAHHLLGKGTFKTATILATFDQPLGQSRRWVNSQAKHLKLIATPSSAAAAEMAQKDPTVVAIGGRLAAEIYGLKILRRNIQDHANNQTRFLVINKENAPLSKAAAGVPLKSTLAFSLSHEPGSLSKVLGAFSDAKVNLTFIQSRPVPEQHYEYRFFIDLLADAHGDAMKTVLKKIKPRVNSLRVLGVYPVQL